MAGPKNKQKRASMREGPLAALFRKTEEAEAAVDDSAEPTALEREEVLESASEPAPREHGDLLGTPATRRRGTRGRLALIDRRARRRARRG